MGVDLHEQHTGNADQPEDDAILRFHRGERLVHWAVAIPFMICYVSAAILVFVYNPEPTRAYRAVFAWIHRISTAPRRCSR